jgi:hypothetical protein
LSVPKFGRTPDNCGGLFAVVAFNPASAGLFFESPWGRFNCCRAERRSLICKDNSARAGIDVFTVRVDKTEGKVDDASAKLAGDSL